MKKIITILIAFLFIISGCTKQSPEQSNQEINDNKNSVNIINTDNENRDNKKLNSKNEEKGNTNKSHSLTDKVVDSDIEFDIDIIDLNLLMKDFHSYTMGDAWLLDFNPKENLLYEGINKDEEEMFSAFIIHDLNSMEKIEVKLSTPYKYIDAIKATSEGINFIGSNSEGTVDYVSISNNGKEMVQELANFNRIAASSSKNGFIVNTENNLDGERLQCRMEYIPFDDKDNQQIVESEYRENKGEITEGKYYTNGYAIGEWVGFQNLSNNLDLRESVNGSYLYNLNTNETISIPFIKDACNYLSGNGQIIVSLLGNYDEKEDYSKNLGIYLYDTDKDEFIKFNIPGYETSNFIRDVTIRGDIIKVHGDRYIDFIQLKSKSIKRIPLQNIDLNLYEVFYSEDTLSFSIVDYLENTTFYYGELNLKSLSD